MDPQQLLKTSKFYSRCKKCDIEKTSTHPPLVARRLSLKPYLRLGCLPPLSQYCIIDIGGWFLPYFDHDAFTSLSETVSPSLESFFSLFFHFSAVINFI